VTSNAMEFKKILIIRLSSMGDIILTTPLLRAVKARYPNAQIDFAVKKEFSSLIQNNPHIHQLIQVDTTRINESVKVIQKNGYDWILNVQKSNRARQLLQGSGNARVTTYNKQRLNRFLLIRLKWNRYQSIKPVIERYFEAASGLNIHYDQQGTEVFYTDAEETKVAQILLQHGIGAHEPFITLCPGAKHNNKRWDAEGFLSLATQLNQNQKTRIVLLGGPDDQEVCNYIQSKINFNLVNLAGQLSLLESAALLKKSVVAVTNDSGLMHLAQSQKIPVIAIFGPTVKEFGFYPLPYKSTVVETQLSCRPCTKMGADTCPKGHHRCMKDISADMVYQAMVGFLK
jgi:lipopolysaccharide heptosyltransferase II